MGGGWGDPWFFRTGYFCGVPCAGGKALQRGDDPGGAEQPRACGTVALAYAGYENLYVFPVDKKAGGLSNKRDKVLAVEAGTLKAPEGVQDDLAMAFINGLAGLWWKSREEDQGEGVSVVVEYPDMLEGLEMLD